MHGETLKFIYSIHMAASFDTTESTSGWLLELIKKIYI